MRGTFGGSPEAPAEAFLFKKWFFDTGYTIREFGEVYDILSTRLPFPWINTRRLSKSFSFGSMKTEILKSR